LQKSELALEHPEEDKPTTLFPSTHFTEIAAEVTQLNDQEYIKGIIAVIEEVILLEQQIQEQIRAALPHCIVPQTMVTLNGLAYHGDQIFVPPEDELKAQILQLYHNSPIASHLGQQGTMELVQ